MIFMNENINKQDRPDWFEYHTKELRRFLAADHKTFGKPLAGISFVRVVLCLY